jgi:hypothetical protein
MPGGCVIVAPFAIEKAPTTIDSLEVVVADGATMLAELPIPPLEASTGEVVLTPR